MSAKKPDLSTLKLRDFLEKHYLAPKLAAEVMNETTASWLRTCVNRLEAFAGRELFCDEVDHMMLENFSLWMHQRGYGKGTRKSYVERIRSVVRKFNRDQLGPRYPTKGLNLNFIDADQQGSLEEVCVKCYLPQNPKTSSPQSVRMYGLALRYFGEFLGRPAMLSDLNDETCAGYQRWLVDVRKNKPITAVGYVKRIKALWTWCGKKRIMLDFPTFQNLPIPEQLPQAWTEEELRKLFKACAKQPGRLWGVKANKFWIAFHLFLWDTGERTGAMLQLRWEWIDRKSGKMAVPGDVRKNAKPICYALKPDTLLALKMIRAPQREIIFPSPDDRSTFYYQYKKLVLSAGLPYVPNKCGPQKMRRTFASFIARAGGDATRALRHTDPRVTIRSYLDPRIAEMHDENEKLFALN